MSKLITAEAVTIGHPDKLCDFIADSILDEALKIDPNARVACEVMASKGEINVAGEITMNGNLPYDDIVSNALVEAGYHATDFTQHFNIHEQSSDIKDGVDRSLEARILDKKNINNGSDELGAGDQGIVMGYACDETPELMPTPITLAHRLAVHLERARVYGDIPFILPDGKTQVTMNYKYNNGVKSSAKLTTIIISTQHESTVSQEKIQKSVIDKVIKPIIGNDVQKWGIEILVNPSGRFVEGGPAADTGLTGRKLMVDTYGGGHHGGGAFSGKDPTKVDRSGAYMARYIAKVIVASGYVTECETQIAYAIGKANPVGFYVKAFESFQNEDLIWKSGSSEEAETILTKAALEVFNMRPAAIIEKFNLRRPIYKRTSVYGHFGHASFPWEQISNEDVEAFKQAVEKQLKD